MRAFLGLRYRLRYLRLRLAGVHARLRPTVDVPRAWYGSDYGGFYVAPAHVNPASIVYSVGIGEDISFDEDVARAHGCEVFGFDPTPKSIEWIARRLDTLPPRFRFEPYGIAAATGELTFYLPLEERNVSGSLTAHDNVSHDRATRVPVKSFADMTGALGHRRVDVLKMDIEGTEFDVLANILDAGVPVGQLLVEFHDRFYSDGVERLDRALATLRDRDYHVFGVSPRLEEVSFIHASLLEAPPPAVVSERAKPR